MTAVTGTASVSTDELYARAAAGLPCWVSDGTGRRIELPMSRWFGHADAAEADRNADHAMVAQCVGSTVDLGCGPGRFTAALTDRGTAALGVDSSAVAVRMTIARGAMAVQRDMFAPLPGTGAWSRVLLADGNIGIGGEPVRVLRRAGELLRPGGLAVAPWHRRDACRPAFSDRECRGRVVSLGPGRGGRHRGRGRMRRDDPARGGRGRGTLHCDDRCSLRLTQPQLSQGSRRSLCGSPLR